MKLYVTYTSPYARLARIVVIENGLADTVTIIEAKTRVPNSDYYKVNPSGRVPYLVCSDGIGMEDSQLICSYLDYLDGKPRLHRAHHQNDLNYRCLEASARSMCDGISVWVREMQRPQSERSLSVLSHEVERSQRMADSFEALISDAYFQGEPNMLQMVLAVALDTARIRGPCDLVVHRPQLSYWLDRMCEIPSLRQTAIPQG
jgi:glutathione S-transferase